MNFMSEKPQDTATEFLGVPKIEFSPYLVNKNVFHFAFHILKAL